MKGDKKKVTAKKRESVESLRSFALSRQDYKTKFEEMKEWFDKNIAEDSRIQVVQKLRDILMVDLEHLDSMNIGRLIHLETEVVQYVLTLGELTADTTARMNFAYVYRKYQSAEKWSGIRDEVFKRGEKITNGELDQITEMSVFEERCVNVFLQKRVDTYKHILSTANQFIRTVQNRIAEQRRQLALKESPEVYG